MTIRVAIIGVGNCASSLIQGINYYTQFPDAPGLIHTEIAGARASDIEVVAAFDVDDRKVGKPLTDAIFSGENCTMPLQAEGLHPGTGVIVQRGMVLDGIGRHMHGVIPVSNPGTMANLWTTLQDAAPDVVINYLPVGSDLATLTYARLALRARAAFINCIPVWVANDPDIVAEFKEAGLPLFGDDIKSQVGATILHQVLVRLLEGRGYKVLQTSQLNVGGNTDFLNMLDEDRLETKRISKTRAVTDVLAEHGRDLDDAHIRIGPSDYVPWLKDRKWAHVHVDALGFGGAPLSLEVKLEVHDSPNSAGVVMDVIRIAKYHLDHGHSGVAPSVCQPYFKSPPRASGDKVVPLELVRHMKVALDALE